MFCPLGTGSHPSSIFTFVVNNLSHQPDRQNKSNDLSAKHCMLSNRIVCTVPSRNMSRSREAVLASYFSKVYSATRQYDCAKQS